MYQVSKHTGNPCIYVLPASRTISIGPADCPSRSCVSCEVIYCSLELDARFRCRTFHVSSPHLLRRYFHLSIFSISFSFLFHSLTPPLSLFLLLLLSPSFSLSSPRQITRYRQQTVTERKIFSGGENCPELVTENTSNSSRGEKGGGKRKRKMVDGRKRERRGIFSRYATRGGIYIPPNT